MRDTAVPLPTGKTVELDFTGVGRLLMREKKEVLQGVHTKLGHIWQDRVHFCELHCVQRERERERESYMNCQPCTFVQSKLQNIISKLFYV